MNPPPTEFIPSVPFLPVGSMPLPLHGVPDATVQEVPVYVGAAAATVRGVSDADPPTPNLTSDLRPPTSSPSAPCPELVEGPAPSPELVEGPAPCPELVEGPPSTPHIPALDAVRGLAILMVTAFRFFPAYSDDPSLAGRLCFRAFEYGGRGVDLFFVLSGFLITGILYDTKSQAHYFKNFYMRRSLRIFPLYYAALALTLLILPAVGYCTSTEYAKGHEYSPWLWLYGTNILLTWEGSWCLGAFNHFWSLAVEEHFYFLWPLVIFLCSRTTAIRVCAAAIAISLATRAAWLTCGGSDVGAQVFTLFRVDALAIGGLLALIARKPTPDGPAGLRALRPYALAVCAIVFISMLPPLQLHKLCPALRETLYAAFFGGFILLAVTTAATSRWTIFANSPTLRWFGRYSYGMYVVQNFLKASFPPELLIAAIATTLGSIFWSRCAYLGIMSVITVVAALVSWNLLEKHFLKLKHRFDYKQPST